MSFTACFFNTLLWVEGKENSIIRFIWKAELDGGRVSEVFCLLFHSSVGHGRPGWSQEFLGFQCLYRELGSLTPEGQFLAKRPCCLVDAGSGGESAVALLCCCKLRDAFFFTTAYLLRIPRLAPGLLISHQATFGWPMKKWKILLLQQKRLVFTVLLNLKKSHFLHLG